MLLGEKVERSRTWFQSVLLRSQSRIAESECTVNFNTIKTERRRLMKKAGVKSFHKLLSLFEANVSLKMSLKRMTDGDHQNPTSVANDRYNKSNGSCHADRPSRTRSNR